MQIFMCQRSGFNRNKLAFFVLSRMRSIQFIFIAIVLFAVACRSTQKDPASLAPKYSLQVVPFDSAFFAMDTLQTAQSVASLIGKYPSFGNDFFSKILMANPLKDTASIKAFYKEYLPIYKDAKKVNALKNEKHNIEEAFKHVHYYFPKYALPKQLILFVGPLESYGNIITKDALALGLQMYLGSNAEWYFSERIQTIYPTYLSYRFAPAYIAVNSVQNILNDMVSEPITGTLITQMVEAGKRQYVINKCFPNAPDSIRFGFTQLQIKSVEQEEAKIWEYVLHSKLTYSTNPADIRSMMQEGVYSDIFGESIPGNVGKYIGYKIVQAWMEQKEQKDIAMETLLTTPADKIFIAAKYAP